MYMWVNQTNIKIIFISEMPFRFSSQYVLFTDNKIHNSSMIIHSIMHMNNSDVRNYKVVYKRDSSVAYKGLVERSKFYPLENSENY